MRALHEANPDADQVMMYLFTRNGGNLPD